MTTEEEIPVKFEDILAAKERIKGHIYETPCAYSVNLASLCGCSLYFKNETAQRCRAFKFRGALNKISQLPKGSTVACVSAGNHSQGTALSATLMGMKAMVYMPITAPVAKVNATTGYGGNVVQHGLSFEDAAAKCNEDLLNHPDWIFIPPFNDKDVIAGQGTIGLEIANQVPDVETVVVSVGGGGLCSGVAIALRHLCPKVRIIAVNAAVRPQTYKKFQTAKGRNIEGVEEPFVGVPLADGIAVKVPGTITFPIIEKLVDEFVVVSEDEIAEAIALLAERAKMVVEGAGAATFAAVHSRKFEFREDEKVCCILSGGNIELQMLSRCIDRSLFLWGRRVYFNISLPLGTDEFINMLKLLRSYRFEIISTYAFPNANCLANHVRYAVTVDMPNPALLQDVQAKFNEYGWKINMTDVHANDE